MPNETSLPQLVVIGSSAGGIEALVTLVSSLPSSFPAPIIVAQHLDPARRSHLEEILARRSTLPVVTVHQHEQLVPGTIFVVPSNHNVEVTDHDITLLPDGVGRSKPSIDLLLNSAAELYGEQLIAVILTGTGSDGAIGARAVKQAGGTVVIQNPSSAAYPSMPQALDPHIVDIVADLPRIGRILFDLCTGVAVPTQADAVRELAVFLEQLRENTGIDFNAYKTPTILRRLQRSIIAAGAQDLAGYTKFLQKHPDEYQRLASTLLIKVTDFMRDPELFDILRDKVLPDLIATSHTRNKELRFWSAGCATGEEAYSLAILALEALGDEISEYSVKIFATDLDGDAIAFARRGFYQASALGQLSPDLIERYFIKSGKGYEVKKQVRSLVVFGEHDLAERAPFPRIDIVLCRNVMIYFTKELQQRALQLFAFALHEGGYLVLGKTETTNPAADFYVAEFPKLKIYRRHGKERAIPAFNFQDHTVQVANHSNRRAPKVPGSLGRELFEAQEESLQARMFKESLLLNLPIGVLVINKRYDIMEINNAARRLLGIHTVAIGDDLLHLAQNMPTKAFRSMIDRTFRENTLCRLDEVQVADMVTGDPVFLRIECYQQPVGINSDEGTEKLPESITILLFDITDIVLAYRQLQETNTTANSQAEKLQTANVSLAAINEELRTSNAALEESYRKADSSALRHAQQIEVLAEANRELLAGNQDLAKSNRELRTNLDDYLVSNEESQAAIEEVETLNEEMQATNEELETLNEEMQATVEELHTSNADMAARGEELQALALTLEIQRTQLEAILAGLADGVLVIGPDGKPLLMNEAYRLMFGVEEPGSSNTLYLQKEVHYRTASSTDQNLRTLSPEELPQARAIRGETFNMAFMLSFPTDGVQRWLEAIGRPVLGEDGQQWGVVVVRDITDRSLRILQDRFIGLASHELRTPLTAIKGYLQILSRSLQGVAKENHLKYIDVAIAQTNKQKRLIEDLLDVARLQSGKFSLQLKPLRLDSLLEQVGQAGQVLADVQNLNVTVNYTTEDEEDAAGRMEGPLTVNGDAMRLEQAVLNLITNAITHAPESTKIDVKLCRAEGVVPAMAEISVHDYGHGIPAEHLSDLFTRFYQVSQGKTNSNHGLGLGLYIAKEIVEAHGGEIAARSVEGKGATFIIRLPILP